MKRHYSEEEIIEGLKSEFEKNRDSILRYFYKEYYNEMINYIIFNYKLAQTEAKDIFQESIISLYENIINNKFNSESSLKTYFYSIIKFKTLNSVKSKKNDISIEEIKFEAETITGDEISINEVEPNLIEEIMKSMTSICRNILTEYYYHKSSMKMIAIKYNFSNEESAKTQKYKCLKKFIIYIENRPIIKEKLRYMYYTA